MTIPLKHVQQRSATRPAGYIDDIMSSGNVFGDSVVIPDDVYAKLVLKYRPQDPTLHDLMSNVGSALLRWVAAGFPVSTNAEIASRITSCRACDLWEENARLGLGKCQKCGCTRIKHWLQTAHCPLERW